MNKDVDVGEMIGDDGSVGGNGSDGSKGDVLCVKQPVADLAKPGGARGTGLGTLDEDLDRGVCEDENDGEDAVAAAEEGQAGRTSDSFSATISSTLVSVPICWECGESVAAMGCESGDGSAEEGGRSG